MQYRKLRDRVVRSEDQISHHLNILSHYDNETLLDKSNKLIKLIKLEGIDFITQDEETLARYKNHRNQLFKHFSSEFALYFWEVRRKSWEYPAGEFPVGFSRDVNQIYQQKIFSSDMFLTEHYFAIMTKPAEGLMPKGFDFIKQFFSRFDKFARQSYLKNQHAGLCDLTEKVLHALTDYRPRILSTYDKNGISFSEPLTFLSKLINFDETTVPLRIKQADIVLPKKRLSFSKRSGTLEMRAGDGSKKFAAMLVIKAYQSVTYAGMLDEISSLNIEFTITQSFCFYDRYQAKIKLRDQQKDLHQARDESVRQADQIDDVIDDTASGEVGYGLHHFTLVCYADTQEELNKHVSTIIARFSDVDIVCMREDTASECAFWAQFPGNFGYILRSVPISTKNMAAFASFHGFAKGKPKGNHWGNAVTLFETLSGSPYYFNFHHKDVGNFLIFGAMGSGKTVLVGFLILQSMKFGGKRIIFDKDRGLEILVRALNGTYERIKPGIATGFNPCQLDDTPENRHFLLALFKKMLGQQPLSENDITLMSNAIDGMYHLDQTERQLCHIASFFGAKKKDSLRSRFDEWHSDGQHAWLFDHTTDTLNLNSDVLGFDLTHILSDVDCKTPALMYLTYRVEHVLEGQRGLIFFDEGWYVLEDEYFKPFIENCSRTPRKKNNIFGLATQVANDTVKNVHHKALNESAACKIFFPNASADKKVYQDAFGLKDKEYELIKNMPDNQHYFLLMHGLGSNKQSVVVRLNLKGLEPLIAVISAREETLQIMDELRTKVGNDSAIWLPLFYQAIQSK